MNRQSRSPGTRSRTQVAEHRDLAREYINRWVCLVIGSIPFLRFKKSQSKRNEFPNAIRNFSMCRKVQTYGLRQRWLRFFVQKRHCVRRHYGDRTDNDGRPVIRFLRSQPAMNSQRRSGRICPCLCFSWRCPTQTKRTVLMRPRRFVMTQGFDRGLYGFVSNTSDGLPCICQLTSYCLPTGFYCSLRVASACLACDSISPMVAGLRCTLR